MKRFVLVSIIATLLYLPAMAAPADFGPGKTIPEFGNVAPIEQTNPISKRTKFKVAFDASKPAEAGELNRSLVSLARFINMHTDAGVKPKNIKLAMVLHSKAAMDVTRDGYYTSKHERSNANAALVKALLDNNVRIIVCGQTAAYYDIKNEDLLPGVEMGLSAMTAHALLQQDGYTLNPF